jgi:hypothetical protein
VPIIRCPECNDQVEIEDDWYGRRIACPSCDRTFTPRRRDDRDDDRDDRPARRRAQDDDRDDDRPPRQRRSRSRSPYDADDRPAKKGNTVLWVVLALVGVFVVLPCVGCIGFVVWGMNARQSFDGPWADHAAGTPPQVTASFPKPPKSKFVSVAGSTGGELMGFDNQNDADNPLEAVFAVGYFDFPAAGGDPLTTHFPAIRQALEEVFAVAPFIAADIDTDTRTSQSGFPTREAVYSKEDGRHTLRIVHLTNRPPGQPVRLVVVIAGGVNLKDEDKQKFLNSVRIAGKAK